MKNYTQYFTILAILFLLSCKSESIEDRTYIGIEHNILYDAPDQYYQTSFTFKNDSVLIKKRPILKDENDSTKFQYEKGIYFYKGIVHIDSDTISIKAFAYNCIDCPVVVEVLENGEIVDVLDQVNYKGTRTNNSLKLNDEIFKIQ